MDTAEKHSENMSTEAQALLDEVMKTFDKTWSPTFGKDKLETLSTDDLIALRRALEEKRAEAGQAMEKLFETEKTTKPKATEKKDFRQRIKQMVSQGPTNRMRDRYEKYRALISEVRRVYVIRLKPADLSKLEASRDETGKQLGQALRDTLVPPPPPEDPPSTEAPPASEA
ncbi:MAG: hypothetical protein WC843_00735 [Candidatus Gracilibacteria bacterium]|jgi:hypothetical protein